MMALMLEDREAPDAVLVRLAANGDRAAFAALVERHYDFMFRVAFRRTGSRVDAEDAAQEVCVRLGRAIRGFRGEGAFTTWLYALTLNAVRDLARKTRRETAKTEAYGVHALIGGEAAEEPQDRAEALWEAVRRLPAKQCDAMLLVYGEGLTHQAASEVMNCAEATVSWHVHEAKKRLREMLSAAGED